MKASYLTIVRRTSVPVYGRDHVNHWWEVELHIPGVGIGFRWPTVEFDTEPPSQETINEFLRRGRDTGTPFIESRPSRIPKESEDLEA